MPKYKAAPFELQACDNNDQADVKIAMYSRKAQFHYGWDWGPRLITCGIWRPISIEAWDKFKIQDVHVQQKYVSSTGVDIISVINILSTSDQTIAASIFLDSINLVTQILNLKRGLNKVTYNSHYDHPQLWWTNGLGAQKLYDYQLCVKDDSEHQDLYSTNIGAIINDVKGKRIPISIQACAIQSGSFDTLTLNTYNVMIYEIQN